MHGDIKRNKEECEMLKRLKKALSKKNKLKRLLYAFRMCLKRPELYPLGRYPNVDIDACVDDYINNMKAAKYYAELLGAKYLSFLQPFNGSGKRQLSAFDIQANAHIKRRCYLFQNLMQSFPFFPISNFL